MIDVGSLIVKNVPLWCEILIEGRAYVYVGVTGIGGIRTFLSILLLTHNCSN